MNLSLDNIGGKQDKGLKKYKDSTFWSRNKKLIIIIILVIFILWVFSIGYVYYWIPRIHNLVSQKYPAPTVNSKYCGDLNQECKEPMKCISYINYSGKKDYDCAIPCPNGDKDCPKGEKCGSIGDGPQNICSSIFN